jgi:hypothetical protein
MATKHDDDDKDDRKKAAADPKPTPQAAGADHETKTTRVGATAAPPGSDMFGHTPEQRELMASNSIGAQIILDYNGDGSLGARGGAGGTIEENTMIRDAHLIAVGLDPAAPSGPPTGEPWVPPEPPVSTRHSVSGHATRMSSLAAGIIAEPDDVPEPPAGTVAGGAR